MDKSIERRNLLKYLTLASTAIAVPKLSFAAAKGEILIIGGGFGGAATAKYLSNYAPQLKVTLIEPNEKFITCPFSNTVLADLNKIDFITHDYKQIQKLGVNVIKAEAIGINPTQKNVTLNTGDKIYYDRLIVASGIDFKFEEIKGHSLELTKKFPHAWKAGAQTLLLRDQLQSMRPGGIFVISVPNNPYRCPPGPYERASLVAHYFKQHNPRAKILILDEKVKFSKQTLFQLGWKELYGDMIEWVPFSQKGNMLELRPDTKELVSEFAKFSGDVLNIIPPQRAGGILREAGLCGDGDWAQINQLTFESIHTPNIHVIGDAALVGDMPKSAFSATSQARLCAFNIAALQSGLELESVPLINTCYSLVAPNYGISVADVYTLDQNHKFKSVPGAGGVSPINADREHRNLEAKYSESWYENLTSDIFN